MKMEEVTGEIYKTQFSEIRYCYDKVNFHELNSYKVDCVHYFIFHSGKYKIGLIMGEKDKVCRLSYSSPFSFFEGNIDEIYTEDYDEIVSLLLQWGQRNGILGFQFRLPPICYDERNISKVFIALQTHGFIVEYADLNYQFQIKTFDCYLKSLKKKPRQNYNKSLKEPFCFIRCNAWEEKEMAYNVIRQNREENGYPLRMSWLQVKETVMFVPNDFFLVKYNDKNVAAAIVFGVTDSVYQVIYWGDIKEYQNKYTMHYLSSKVYEYYANKKINMLDIGPSTEEGVPNIGLCTFKEKIGCETSLKFTLQKMF